MSQSRAEDVTITQSVAILVDGNNIERSIHDQTGDPQTMLNFDTLIPKLLDNRGLNRLVYFREGRNISSKLEERLHYRYHGSVRPCHKSADIPLTIKAMQLASKVDQAPRAPGVMLHAFLASNYLQYDFMAPPDKRLTYLSILISVCLTSWAVMFSKRIVLIGPSAEL